MKPDYVVIYRSKRGLLRRTQFRARVMSGNGNVLFVSAESYNNWEDLQVIIDRLFPDLQCKGIYS